MSITYVEFEKIKILINNLTFSCIYDFSIFLNSKIRKKNLKIRNITKFIKFVEKKIFARQIYKNFEAFFANFPKSRAFPP